MAPSPVAIAAGCKKCPIFSVCPAKGIIGDQKKPVDDATQPLPEAGKHTGKRKKR